MIIVAIILINQGYVLTIYINNWSMRFCERLIIKSEFIFHNFYHGLNSIFNWSIWKFFNLIKIDLFWLFLELVNSQGIFCEECKFREWITIKYVNKNTFRVI